MNTRTNINIWQAMSGKIKCRFGGRQSKSGSHGRKLRNLWRPGIMPAIRQVLNNWQLLHTGETNFQTSLWFRIKRIQVVSLFKKKKKIYLMNLQKVIDLHRNVWKNATLVDYQGPQRVLAAFRSLLVASHQIYNSEEIPAGPSFCQSLPTTSF